MNAKSLVPGTSTLKSLVTIISSLAVIYGLLFTLGIAPITNGQAETMVAEAIENNNKEIKNEIKMIRKNQDTLRSSVITLKNQNEAIKDNSTRTDHNVQRIYELLIHDVPR